MLRWLLPSLVPALLFVVLLRFSDRAREPWRWVLGTFALGAVFGGGALWLEQRAMIFTGLDWSRTGPQSGALVFLFAFAAPVREAAKVAAAWPAFRSKYFDEPYDGVVYAGAAGLGFAAIDNAVLLRGHPEGGIWIVRALLGLPAHVFFACAWGYALGRARQKHDPGPLFPGTWLLATLIHGLYYFLCVRSAEALVIGTLPILLIMGVLTLLIGRDLQRSGPPTLIERRISRITAGAPNLSAVRAALRSRNEPLRPLMLLLAAVVTLGAMIAGLASAIGFGLAAHVDFSRVDERDLGTAAPIALLGAGVLAAFPTSGFLLAKAGGRSSLLEPALGSALAIIVALGLLGVAAPLALLVALAFSPVAWALACAGAWIGRPSA